VTPGAHLGMLDTQLFGAATLPWTSGCIWSWRYPRAAGWREGERWNPEIAWEFLLAHSSWDEMRLALRA